MDTHLHPPIHAPASVEVHEGHEGAGDEPVAVVAVAVLLAIATGVCILWWYASTH